MDSQLPGVMFGGGKWKDVEEFLFMYDNVCEFENLKKKAGSDFGYPSGVARLGYRSSFINE